MMKLSYKSVQFELVLNIEGLTNIPQLDNNICYMQRSISNSRLKTFKQQQHHKDTFTSKKYPVKDHKCSFEADGKSVIPVKLYADPKDNYTLSDKWLQITFIIEDPQTNSKEKLGLLELNLTEYVNERSPVNLRYLLKKSKTNSILKFSIFVKHLQSDQSFEYNIPNKTTSQIYQGLKDTIVEHHGNKNNASSGSVDTHLSAQTSPPGSPGSTGSPRSKGFFNHGVMHHDSNKNQLSVPNQRRLPRSSMEVSDSKSGADQMLCDIVNKTFRFTWQYIESRYEEYTPSECIRDIVEYNGNGWKKNDEGMNYIDVIHNDFNDLNHGDRNLEKNRYKEFNYPDGLADSALDYETNGDSGNKSDTESTNDSDVDEKDDYILGVARFTKTRAQPKKKISTDKYMPVEESEFRHNLRSWHLNYQ